MKKIIFVFFAFILCAHAQGTQPRISDLVLIEESGLSAAEITHLLKRNIDTGNYPNQIHDSNYPDQLHDGNYPDQLHDANYPDQLHDGNYPDQTHGSSVERVENGDLPSPQLDL